MNISCPLSQELSIKLAEMANVSPGASSGSANTSGLGVPLLARVYLKLGTWQWALSQGLEEESIAGIKIYGGFLIFADDCSLC